MLKIINDFKSDIANAEVKIGSWQTKGWPAAAILYTFFFMAVLGFLRIIDRVFL